MYLIWAERYKNVGVGFKKVRKTDKIWTSMKDIGSGVGVKNISDLVLKEIHGILNTKNPTKEQINEYKMTDRNLWTNFANLSKKELNTKSNKNVYARNFVMTTIIKRCRDEKKRCKSNRWI